MGQDLCTLYEYLARLYSAFLYEYNSSALRIRLNDHAKCYRKITSANSSENHTEHRTPTTRPPAATLSKPHTPSALPHATGHTLTVPDVLGLCLQLGVRIPHCRRQIRTRRSRPRHWDRHSRSAAALPRAHRGCILLIHLRSVRSASAPAPAHSVFGAGAVGRRAGAG